MEQLEELEETFVEEYQSALMLFELKKYKSATILISKALFALVDYVIFKRYQKLANNHNERFRFLKQKDTEIYEIVDSVWGRYTDTYSKPAMKESIILLKNGIKEIINKDGIFSERIKEIVNG